MFFISEVCTKVPDKFITTLQEEIYKILNKLQIPFKRVNTDEAITMEDCIQIEEKLDMKMVKTLFLCNRQKTSFYLFVTTANKPFKTKDFSNVLGISRVSFAPENLMEDMLGTKVGATTIFSAILDKDSIIQIVLDKEVIKEKWYGCSDGTTTNYLKIETTEIINNFLPFSNHKPLIIEV